MSDCENCGHSEKYHDHEGCHFEWDVPTGDTNGPYAAHCTCQRFETDEEVEL